MKGLHFGFGMQPFLGVWMKSLRKRILAVATVLGAVVAVIGLVYGRQVAQSEESVYTKYLFAMDTYFILSAYGPEGEEALEQCEEKVLKLEAALSVTKSDSDVSELNTGESKVVSEDTFLLVQEALKLCEGTNGALDITLYPVLRAWGFTTDAYRVPDGQEIETLLEKVDYRGVIADEADLSIQVPEGAELDLGAVAKGYTGDCLLEILRENGVTSAMLDLGGNVQTLGSKPDGSPWKVAVRDPLSRTGESSCLREIGVLEVVDKCVITSGSYERYFEENSEKYWHILDPADGYPADSGLVSVTIVGDSGVRCDGLSTALFVMGKDEAVNFWRQAKDFEMILVTEAGTLYITEGLQESFVCSEGWNAEIISR